MTNQNHQVFISYASPDRDRVIPFYESMVNAGFDVWIDYQKLLAGQNWDFEIKRAFDKSSFIVTFISSNSFNKRGYVQRELKMALDNLTERLVDDIYLIPVLLDDNTSLPDQLKAIHAIRASDPESHKKIADAIRYQLNQIGVETLQTQRQEDVHWTSHITRESWEGLPGYEVEIEFLDFRSNKYLHLSEIGEFIKGNLTQSLFDQRSVKLMQSPDLFNYGQDKFIRTNTYDAHCGEPKIKGKILTVSYSVHWYGAGAVHPNYFFKTFSFVLEPLFLIESLHSVFINPERALALIQDEVRKQLYEKRFGGDENADETALSREWIDEGTKDWTNFSSFVFDSDGVELLFAPYQVAAYVFGPQSAKVTYSRLAELMRDEYRHALHIDYMAA